MRTSPSSLTTLQHVSTLSKPDIDGDASGFAKFRNGLYDCKKKKRSNKKSEVLMGLEDISTNQEQYFDGVESRCTISTAYNPSAQVQQSFELTPTDIVGSVDDPYQTRHPSWRVHICEAMIAQYVVIMFSHCPLEENLIQARTSSNWIETLTSSNKVIPSLGFKEGNDSAIVPERCIIAK